MVCKLYGQFGMETFVVGDDVTNDEIARIANIIVTTEPGNGNGRIIYRKENEQCMSEIE